MKSKPFRQEAASPDVRGKILAFIKSRDKALVQEVARHFRISHEGARKQLVHLEKEGWIFRKPSGEGVGRPRDVYAVTEAGEHQLPKAYDKLSLAMLSTLKEGAAGLRQTLAALAKKQVEAWKPRLKGKSLPEKMEALRHL